MRVHFVGASLSAIAFSRVCLRNQLGEKALRYDPWVIPRIGFVVAMTAVAMSWLDRREQVAAFPLIIAGPVLLMYASVILIRAHSRPPALIALIVFTSLDLGAYGLSYGLFPPSDRMSGFAEVASSPLGQRDYRVAAHAFSAYEGGNRFAMLGWRQVDGYSGLPPSSRLLDGKPHINIFQVAGVRWVARGGQYDDVPGLIPRVDDWFEVPNPLPRARLVSKVHVSKHLSRDIATAQPDTAFVGKNIDRLSGVPGKCEIVEDRPGAIRVQVKTDGRQLLVLSDRFHDGWQVSIDEEACGLHRVYGDFMGCVVGPGSHEVQFRFRPDSLHHGKVLSLFGLAFLPMCTLVSSRRFDRTHCQAARE